MIVGVPASQLAACFEANVVTRADPLQTLESDFTQNVPDTGGIALAETTFIFIERHVKVPMQVIFYAPMRADSAGKSFNISQRCDEISRFDARFALLNHGGTHRADARNPFPVKDSCSHSKSGFRASKKYSRVSSRL